LPEKGEPMRETRTTIALDGDDTLRETEQFSGTSQPRIADLSRDHAPGINLSSASLPDERRAPGAGRLRRPLTGPA